MLKWLLTALIVLAAGVTGVRLGRSLTKRREQLEQLAHGLHLLETEMLYARYPLAHSLKNVSDRLTGEVSEVFRRSAGSLADGSACSGEASLAEAMAAHAGRLSLTPNDLEIMTRFARNLGASDLEGQRRKLSLTEAELSDRISAAREQEKKWRRICTGLGWMSGLVLVLLCW